MTMGLHRVVGSLQQPPHSRGNVRHQDLGSSPKDSPETGSSHNLQPPQNTGDAAEEEPLNATMNGRQWVKGVTICAWVAFAVLLLNVLLTAVATGLAYQKNSVHDFVSASLYEGKCSVAKNSATILHLLINVLSTVMLGASNYCMQCLAAPTRTDVDKAHQRNSWVRIGVPNILDLLIYGRGKRRLLGSILLLTSLPFHLMYTGKSLH